MKFLLFIFSCKIFIFSYFLRLNVLYIILFDIISEWSHFCGIIFSAKNWGILEYFSKSYGSTRKLSWTTFVSRVYERATFDTFKILIYKKLIFFEKKTKILISFLRSFGQVLNSFLRKILSNRHQPLYLDIVQRTFSKDCWFFYSPSRYFFNKKAWKFWEIQNCIFNLENNLYTTDDWLCLFFISNF